jgi:mannose-6-phosphate isomerase-like protein (cupin superfamily)
MAVFNKDMVDLATKNTHFQKEAYRDAQIQIVLMHLQPGEDIGMETHRADQTTFIVSGEGQAVVDGQTTRIGPNHMVVVPKGSEHNFINKGTGPLKLFSVYAPPAEEKGVDNKTKADAQEAEKGVIEKLKEKITG